MEFFDYKTLRKPVENVILKQKSSRFIGYGFPVFNEDQVKENLQKLKNAHPKATHHCYAFRLGTGGENYRANDDGEPGGSAGLPIYNQLLAQEITNVLLVVVRYYGGTKLGVSGLIKAYKECAKLTLSHAEIITKVSESTVEIRFAFAQQNQIFTLLQKFDGKMLSFLSDEECKITAAIRSSMAENFAAQVAELPNISLRHVTDQ